MAKTAKARYDDGVKTIVRFGPFRAAGAAAAIAATAMLVAFASCATRAPARTAAAPQRQAVPAVRSFVETERAKDGSEFRHHQLELGGRRMPDAFQLVVIDSVAWVFLRREGTRADDGYVMLPEPLALPASPETFEAADRAAGYYQGQGVKRGTPASWAYGQRGNVDVHFDPARVDAVVRALGLAPIPRR